jgi:hypothetical protein
VELGRRTLRGLTRTTLVLAAVGIAPAVLADLPDVLFTVKAMSADGVAEYQLTLNEAGWQRGQDQWEYNSGETIKLIDPDTQKTIAELQNVELFFRADPQINLSFAVQAGGTDTLFLISSGLLEFATIQNADGQASAAFTVTDTNNDGADLTGEIGTDAGDRAYAAYYNGLGANLFSGLVSGLSVPAGSQSRSTAENDPLVGYRSVGADVESMNADISFTLTASDLASGTTSYEIIPEPSALVLLGLGALSLLRRK